MSSRFKFSQSKIVTFRTCLYKGYLRYSEKLRPKIIARPLQFGSVVHELLEAECNGRDPMRVLRQIERKNRDLFKKQKELYGEIVRDIRWIMQEYQEVYELDPVEFVKIKGKRAEHAFEVEIDDDLLFEWRVDSFAKTRNGLLFLWENKTGTKQMDATQEMTSVQAGSYIRAGELLGLPHIDGTAWNFVLSKPPTVPQLTKKGTLSVRADIVTLPTTVEATIKEHGLNPKDYADLLEIAKTGRSRYFNRRFLAVSKRAVDDIWTGLLATARRVADDPNYKNREKNIGRHCSWCDFKKICTAEITGKNSDTVKELHFEVRKKEEEIKPKEKKSSRKKARRTGRRSTSSRRRRQ